MYGLITFCFFLTAAGRMGAAFRIAWRIAIALALSLPLTGSAVHAVGGAGTVYRPAREPGSQFSQPLNGGIRLRKSGAEPVWGAERPSEVRS